MNAFKISQNCPETPSKICSISGIYFWWWWWCPLVTTWFHQIPCCQGGSFKKFSFITAAVLPFTHIFSSFLSCVDKKSNDPSKLEDAPAVYRCLMKVKTSKNKRQKNLSCQVQRKDDGWVVNQSGDTFLLFFALLWLACLKGVHLKPLDGRRGACLFQGPALIPPFQVKIRFAKGSRTMRA